MDPPAEDDEISKTHKFSLNSGFKRYAKMGGSFIIVLFCFILFHLIRFIIILPLKFKYLVKR